MSSVQKLRPSDKGLTEIVAQVSLFEDIRESGQPFHELVALMEERKFAKGDTIIAEGSSGNEFYVLAEGQAGVFKKTQDGDLYKVAILHGHKGAFFGEGALLEADTRTATITAESECQCLILDKKHFEQFCKQYPQFALPVLRRVATAVMHRLRNMNQDLSLLYKALVEEIRGK